MMPARRQHSFLFPILIAILATTSAAATAFPQTKATDFNGVWSIVSFDSTVLPENNHPVFTEEGKRRIQLTEEFFKKLASRRLIFASMKECRGQCSAVPETTPMRFSKPLNAYW